MACEPRVPLRALVDSGAAANLIDLTLAKQLQIPFLQMASPREVQALDGRPLGSGSLEFQTPPLTMQVGDSHFEEIQFYLIDTPLDPIVLGYPWLMVHQPTFDWRRVELLEWGGDCSQHARVALVRRGMAVGEGEIGAAVPSFGGRTVVQPVEVSEEEDMLRHVPSEYHDLAEVFSKERAMSLPPNRPFDCAIELVPGQEPPRGRLYSLTQTETVAMDTYIQEALQQGLIRPSRSPAAASFFFVGKKDGSLRPCIDYRGLNKITIKNKYPLPLMNTTFERLQGAQYFTKLDLRNAYHLVRIRPGDEWKTAFITPRGQYEYSVMPFGLTNAPSVFQALINHVLREFLESFVYVYLDDILVFSKDLGSHVSHVRAVLSRLLAHKLFVKVEKSEFHTTSTSFLGFVISQGGLSMANDRTRAIEDWPVPLSVKQLQRFLGFANFFRRFICGFSLVAAPLTALLKGAPKTLRWTSEAQQAFDGLKHRFSTAPVLVHPDPGRPFVVEVDASDTGVGAILSQRASDDRRLHPCAYFSRRLTPAESRYDVGDRELLAVKMALDEWRHWLEGSTHSFQVWTDHKNLAYLKEARRLNPRQARWALFFSRFVFTLTYRPGVKNAKADSLSRLFSPDSSVTEPGTILPEGCVLAPVRWVLLEDVRGAHCEDPPPPETPADRHYVPQSQRAKVLEWAHSARTSGHPGVRGTSQVLSRLFWWPSLEGDVKEFVAACSVCAAHKTDHQRPQGLLLPLSVPRRPWSI